MDMLKSLSFEIILTIIVNFLSDFIPFGAFMWGLYMLEVHFLIAYIIFFIIIFRVIVLPIYYAWLEKRTKNELIRNFIEKLRHNRKTRFLMLIPVSYTITCLSFSLMALNFKFGISFAFYLFSLFLGSAGNYLALFTFWIIVDLYKKKKQES